MKLTAGQRIFKEITDYLKIIFSISGFVPKNKIVAKTLLLVVALSATFFFGTYFYGDATFAVAYFLVTTTLYLAFIYSVLPEKGYRHWFMQKFGGEKGGYAVYETVLGFIFFVQGAGIGYISSSLPLEIELSATVETIIRAVAILLFITGFTVKVWATKVVSVEIYYWKDMFLGRKVRDFVVKGPYKYVRNPMYGLGHLQVYASAMWYFSLWGLLFAAINQLCIFSFYFLQEKKFINRVYKSKVIRMEVLKKAKIAAD